MARILANDGIAEDAKRLLEKAGHEVVTDKIAQEDLDTELNNFDGIVVRSATKVRADLIDKCPNLKFIGRAGVGMDNIDVAYARDKGITVSNTPSASSQSVAELVLAHMFAGARYLHHANREMPSKGDTEFKALKKDYSKGYELRGKNIGIIGFGGIGQALGRMCLGLGMNVLPFSLHHDEVRMEIDFFKVEHASLNIHVKTDDLDTILKYSDFISLHVPSMDTPLIGREEFSKMKDGVAIINTSRGGVIDEEALIEALDSGKVRFAGLDVFENEPTPRKSLLEHPNVIATPHIGGSTVEAQQRIGIEMAEIIIDCFKA